MGTENQIPETAPLADKFPTKIPEGIYNAICYKTETAKGFGGETKIYLKFRIFGGEYCDTELYMVCNYPQRMAKPRLKYYGQWMMAARRHPNKKEKLSPKIFLNRMFKVAVRDTRPKFPNGKFKPDFFKYSVVDTILEALTG
jgi:hypothetical protein